MANEEVNEDELSNLEAITLSGGQEEEPRAKGGLERLWVRQLMREVNRLQADLAASNTAHKEHDDLLRSIADTLGTKEHHRRFWEEDQPSSLPLESCEVGELVKLALDVFDKVGLESSTVASSLRASANRILLVLAPTLLDYDMTKLVYDYMIERVDKDPDDEHYCEDLVSRSALCLAGLKLEHVITKDEAFDLIKQLTPVAGKSLPELSCQRHPSTSVELLEVCHEDRPYYPMVCLLVELQRYAGPERYRKHVYSTVRATETNSATADAFVAINVLAVELLPDFSGRNMSNEDTSYIEFVRWLLLLVENNGPPYRAHLIYLVYHLVVRDDEQIGGLRLFATDEFCLEVTERLLENFLSRDDDLMSDCLIMDHVHQCLQDHSDRALNVLSGLSEPRRQLFKAKLERLDSDAEFAEVVMKRDNFYKKGYIHNYPLARSLIERLDECQRPTCQLHAIKATR